jgi:hypothetical protein
LLVEALSEEIWQGLLIFKSVKSPSRPPANGYESAGTGTTGHPDRIVTDIP